MKFFVKHQQSIERQDLSQDETRYLNLTELKSKMEAIETILCAEEDDFYLIDNNQIKMQDYETWLLLTALLPQNAKF